jgi:hypothetical protein
MKITKVSYRRLVSDGKFNNESHGGEAIVDDGQNPDTVHAQLVYWVDDIIKTRFHDRDSGWRIATDVQALGIEKDNLERQCAGLKIKIDKMVEFLRSHGVDLRDDEIPF